MSLQTTISSNTNARLKVERYIDHTIDQMVTRTIGKDPLSAIIMWDLSGDVALNTIQRNPLLWADDLKDQLSGYFEYKHGGWGQGAGGSAITSRHLLNCAHWGASPVGGPIRFIKGDGSEYFETTILAEYPPGTPEYMTFEGNTYDLEVFLLADELPTWVNIFPIIRFDGKHKQYLPSNQSRSSGKFLPTIKISQGINGGSTIPQKLYIKNDWFCDIYDTIADNGSNYGFYHPSPYLNPYRYSQFVGDSGTPTFTLIDGILYLIGGPGGLPYITNTTCIGYINELIRRADLSQSIDTGYTVSVVDFDTLQF